MFRPEGEESRKRNAVRHAHERNRRDAALMQYAREMAENGKTEAVRAFWAEIIDEVLTADVAPQGATERGEDMLSEVR